MVAVAVQSMDGGDVASLPVKLDEAERTVGGGGDGARGSGGGQGVPLEQGDEGGEGPRVAELM